MVVLTVVSFMMVASFFIGVPFVPVKMSQAKKMIEIAGVKDGMKVVDLGSGAGRLLFLSAKKGGQAIGYELNPILYYWTKFMVLVKGLKNKVKVHHKSIYKADLKDIDVVLTYLMPGPMGKLSNKLFSELKPGAKIVTYAFYINDRKPVLKDGKIAVYEVR